VKSDTSIREDKLHISDIDGFLASLISREIKSPIKLRVNQCGNEGFIKVFVFEATKKMADGGIDFELSSDENLDLDRFKLTDLLGKSVYTSSAYELFDFILMNFDWFECLVEFKENAWRVNILRAENT